MHVAYLINLYPKVSHTFIRREIKALERSGLKVMRISVRGWDSELLDPEDHAEREQTRYVLRAGAPAMFGALIRALLTRPAHLMRAFGLACHMSRRSERSLPFHLVYLAEACLIFFWLRKADIVHLHAHFGTNPAEVAMLVHALGGPPWSFTVHGPEEFDKAEALGLSEKIRCCAFVVAISSYGRSQLFRCAPHQHWGKVSVVHCGLEATFREAASNCPPEARRLICVGRLCEQKGQLLLLEAAYRLAAQGTNFELLLIGDGEMRAELEELIIRYDLADKVRITGWLSGPRIREEIVAARALILPSFAEGLPVSIMEAMALRRPVITTFVAGIPELVLPDVHGWLVPAGDVGSLMRAMELCLNASPDVLVEMGIAASKRVFARHSVDLEAAKLAALFQSSMEAKPA